MRQVAVSLGNSATASPATPSTGAAVDRMGKARVKPKHALQKDGIINAGIDQMHLVSGVKPVRIGIKLPPAKLLCMVQSGKFEFHV